MYLLKQRARIGQAKSDRVKPENVFADSSFEFEAFRTRAGRLGANIDFIIQLNDLGLEQKLRCTLDDTH